MERAVGIHVRLTGTLPAAVEMARRIGASGVQFFFIHQITGRYIQLNTSEINEFLQIKQQLKSVYIHSSYWINIARVGHNNHDYLHYECAMAEKLQCNYIIVHSGTTKGSSSRLDGIDAVARTLNQFNKKYKAITIVLENTAYSGMSIGSDLQDFALIRAKLNDPERVLFCIDTAHAHAYGYDIVTSQGLHDFILLLDATLGIDNICLIHLNDTSAARGSHIDRHDIIGQGVIGIDTLKQFATHPLLGSIPLILELPILEEHEMQNIISTVRQW